MTGTRPADFQLLVADLLYSWISRLGGAVRLSDLANFYENYPQASEVMGKGRSKRFLQLHVDHFHIILEKVPLEVQLVSGKSTRTKEQISSLLELWIRQRGGSIKFAQLHSFSQDFKHIDFQELFQADQSFFELFPQKFRFIAGIDKLDSEIHIEEAVESLNLEKVAQSLSEFVRVTHQGLMLSADLKDFYSIFPDSKVILSSHLKVLVKRHPNLLEFVHIGGCEYLGTKDKNLISENLDKIKSLAMYLNDSLNASQSKVSFDIVYEKYPSLKPIDSQKLASLLQAFSGLRVKKSSLALFYSSLEQEKCDFETILGCKYTKQAKVISNFLNQAKSFDRIGLDLEGDFESNRISLLTFNITGVTVVFDLSHSNAETMMKQSGLSVLLQDPTILKICYGAHRVEELLRATTGISLKNVWDIQVASSLLNTDPTSSMSLGEILRDYEIQIKPYQNDKFLEVKNWFVRPITELHIFWTSSSVEYLIQLYGRMYDDAFTRSLVSTILSKSEETRGYRSCLPGSHSRVLRTPFTPMSISSPQARQAFQAKIRDLTRRENLRKSNLCQNQCYHFHFLTPGHCPTPDCKFEHDVKRQALSEDSHSSPFLQFILTKQKQ